MNPATTALNSTASAAANGIAGLTFPILTGILVHPNRAWANFFWVRPRLGIGDCTAANARILDGGAHLR